MSQHHQGTHIDEKLASKNLATTTTTLQTAGESQYQDQSSASTSLMNLTMTDPSTNPFASPPPASAPPPPPPSDDSSSASPSNFMGYPPTHYNEYDNTATGNSIAPNTPDRLETQATTTSHRIHEEASSNRSYISYQSYGSASTTNTTRAASVPAITNYGISPAQTFFPKGGESLALTSPNLTQNGQPPSIGSTTTLDSRTMKRYLTGDTSVRPNVGQTNAQIGGIGSLREITSRLRWMTIACTLTALMWEGFAFPERLLLHTWDHPAKVVLGGYLAFFCLLLLGVEFHVRLRDSFGVLYHPLGRGCLLILLSTMCYGILIVWWEFLLCIAFFLCSMGYIYAYIKYPEYRRWQDYNDNYQDMFSAFGRRKDFGGNSRDLAHWADPTAEASSFREDQAWSSAQRETQSLLHQF